MTLNISFLHADSTPALKERIQDKSEHIKKYFDTEKIDIQWTCSVEKNAHSSIVTLRAGHRYFYAKGTSDDLYKSFDEVLKKLENQFHHKKSHIDHESVSEYAVNI
ncbi:ribosome-associated translation inhibitor RaiA [Bacteriovoracaceae bacterium]|nr:ribosome-associated translation inhibitor RaiA [Bacteriovoracaceae bacterium]